MTGDPGTASTTARKEDERQDLLRRALGPRVVAIVRLPGDAPLLEVAEALVRGGITCLELTMTTRGALEAIERCRAHFGDGVVIGAGTVLTAEDARRCLAAGAQFIVSPDTAPEVIRATREGGALSMPGAMTPTEIVRAWRAGADVVKVFPARSLGPRYISDVLAPLPHIPLMPTGGVDATNAGDFLKAGAVAVAVGGRLVSGQTVAARDWQTLERGARELVEAVASVPENA